MIISELPGGSGAQVDKENVAGTRDEKDDVPAAHLLNLEISDSFLSSIKLMLAWDRNAFLQSRYNDRSKYEELRTAQNHLVIAKKGKRAPSDMPVLTLAVGNKQFIRTDDCHIFASFCYLTKKVLCQLHYEKLRRKVQIPFSDITSLLVRFDQEGFDTLKIEARSSLKYFFADKPHFSRFTRWKVDECTEECFPESKFVSLKIEKGVLEKGLAKLLYTDPRLQRTLSIAREGSGDQHMYQGLLNAPTQHINMSALQPVSSNNEFPYIGG